MSLRFVDWIWRVRGTVSIEPPQPAAEAFGKLDRLLQEKNTDYRIDGDTLTFTKKNQLPQDKMSIFDGGTWRIANGSLRYEMKSRALLACFLAPLFFFAIGEIGVAMDQWRNPPELAKAKAEAAKKRSKIKAEDVPMNPVDKFLGAPKPEKKKDGDDTGKKNRKPSMTTAYVFMGIFFALWVVGRILEHRLIHLRITRALNGNHAAQAIQDDGGASRRTEPGPFTV